MSKPRVHGDGPLTATILICAERPGVDEVEQGRGLVGRSGIEWFGGWVREELPKGSGRWRDVYREGRWERLVGIPREEVRVENLVRTYKTEPPAEWEVRRDAPELWTVLRRMKRLRLVVSIGAHATGWFLGRPVAMDLVGGVPHLLDEWTVIPVVHPAAALRAPEQYQERLSSDLRGVRRWLDGQVTGRRHEHQAPITIASLP